MRSDLPPFAASLSGIPFPDQKRLIARAVDSGHDLERLLESLAALPDHEPLALALRWIIQRRGLANDAVVAATATLLRTLPDHGVHRVLSGLDPATLDADQSAILATCVRDAAASVPVDRIAAMCLMTRWLRRADPHAAEQLTRAAETRCAQDTDPDTVDDTSLVHVRGRTLAALHEDPRWRARVQGFASRVLEVLGAQPKSLSQANAEELLARRVYAEPAHFLFELLQNAEDAGATCWHVDFCPGEVRVRHDGAPFDARDVVGVLSIGQTTKRADQIGLFGVGFKAVYEVCERPQIASGAFHFEIADVSLPRELHAPAREPRESGTLLVLPLRDHVDAAALFEHARALPSETLLTLGNIHRWRFTLGERTHTISKRAGADGSVVLLHEETGEARAFVVASGEASWSSAHPQTPVKVALALDAAGAPTPVLQGPTVFSHLPTGERSGLRFLVHARFDVPLDRERLDLQSAKNLAALARAGELLLEAVERLLARGAGADLPNQVLCVLPLRSELGHPAFARLLDAFARAASSVPILGGAAGELLTPRSSVALPEPSLAVALAGLPLDPANARPLAWLDPRSEAVCVGIGAARWTFPDVVQWLARAAGYVGEHGEPHDARLIQALPVVLDALGRSGAALESLRSVPCLPDGHGRLHAPDRILRANGLLRAAYADVQPLLDPRLADEPTDGQRRLLDSLGVRRVEPRDLACDLTDELLAHRLLDPDRDEVVLAALEHAPQDALEPIAALPRFRDEDGRLRPLASQEPERDAWLAPGGELGRIVRMTVVRKLRLVAAGIQERFAPLLQRLGARTLSPLVLLQTAARGEVWFAAEGVRALHRWLDEARGELTSHMAQAVARAPIFPDRSGRLRPLAGDQRAWVADDPDVEALFPTAPWLASQLASSPVLAGLPIERVGAEAVVRAWIGAPGAWSIPPEWLRASSLYAYLACRGGRVRTELAERLAGAPVWRDERGNLHALSRLRSMPRDPELLALYRAWERFPLIDGEGPASARAAVRGLRLDRHLVEPDAACLISDLMAAPPLEEAARRMPELVRALNALPGRVPRDTLAKLERVPLFQASSGAWLPLSAWSEPGDQGCRRALGAVRGALEPGSRPLLSDDDEATFAPLLAALGVAPATLEDMARALVTDPLLAVDKARDAARRALVFDVSETALCFPPPGPGLTHPALAALPIWPTADGRRLPPGEVIRAGELQEALGDLAALAGGSGSSLALLAQEADEDANRLRGIVFFRDPMALLAARVRDTAKEGEPIGNQPELLGAVDRVVRILALLSRYRGGAMAALELPLAVDAAGRLVRGALSAASPEEIALVEGLPIHARLADPQWAKAATQLDPQTCPPVLPRRIAAALAEHCRNAVRAVDHPLLASDARRRALYGWLERSGVRIEADPDAMSVLARACLVPDADGVLRAPRDLLIDEAPPGLDLPGGLSPEVPEGARSWMRRAFRLEDERVRQLVERVLDAHEQAVSERDVERSVQLLGYLAFLLVDHARGDPTALASAARRWDVRKRLRVATVDGSFERPRRLVMPDPGTWELLIQFDAQPPQRPHAAYAAKAVPALLTALGAQPDLQSSRIGALLAGGGIRPGTDARVALACYVARRAFDTPALRNEWRLDRDAWMPDAAGALRIPSELFWPDATIRAMLGNRPGLYPDPTIVRTLPESIARWLRCRGAADVALADAVAGLPSEEPAPAPILEWIEDALVNRRAGVDQVRAALVDRIWLVDDEGMLRDPQHLVTDDAGELRGRGWGQWAAGRRWPRLAAALRIPERAGPREHRRFLEETAGQITARGAQALLAEDSDLPDVVLRLSLSLAECGKLASRAPVACEDPETGVGLVSMPGDSVVVADRIDLAEACAERGVALRMALLPDDAPERIIPWLQALGATPLSSLWEPRVAEPGAELGAPHDSEADVLGSSLRALWKVLPRAIGGGVGFGPAPDRVRIVSRLAVRGALGPGEVLIETACAFERYEQRAGRGALLVTPGARADLALIAKTCWCDGLLGKPDDRERIELIWSLLRARTEAAMHAELDALSGAPRPVPTSKEQGESPARRRAEPAAGDVSAPRRGWFQRLQDWLVGEEPAERSSTPFEPPTTRAAPPASRKAASQSPEATHASWFQPQDIIGPQLDDLRDWLARRDDRPRFGFAHTPPRLGLPWLYAPKLIADQFDTRTQRWSPRSVDPTWSRPASEGQRLATMRGRVPAGEVVLPVPLYARVVGIDGASRARVVSASSGQLLLITSEPADVTLRLALDSPPAFDQTAPCPPAPKDMTTPSVLDEELPGEVLAFVGDCVSSGASPFERALEVREFIRENYRYDPTYMGDPALARWLRSVSDGRASMHIAALHAGRDARHLGRGVCYELNALACELLRKVGVPAAVATGWTLDRGAVSEPDHMWAMALLPTPEGWRWFPVDAAATREGRPLHAQSAKAKGPWRVPPATRRHETRETASWNRREQESSKQVRKPKRRAPIAELMRAVRHAERVGKVELESVELQERCREVLSDPELAAALVALIKRAK